MSELYTKLVFGQTRKVLTNFKKGERITYHPDGDVVFNQACVVDTIQVYKKRDPYYVMAGEEFGEWKFEKYLWNTLRPVSTPTPLPPPPPPPPDPKPSFWVRLFKRNKIPQARLVTRD